MGFVAEYDVSDGSILRLDLSPGDPVLARDGSQQPAYRLAVNQFWPASQSWPEVSMDWMYHLDADLGVIRYDSLCAEHFEDECVRHRLYWYTSGQPAGYGVGLPMLAPSSGVHEVVIGALEGHFQVQIERTGNGGTWTIKVEDDEFIGPGTLLPGEYRFVGDELVPVAFRMDRKGAVTEAKRTSFEKTGPLPVIDASPLAPGTAEVGAYVMFPGEELRLLNRSDSPLNLTERAREEVPEFDASMRSGCVAGFGINERPTTDGGPVIGLPGQEEVADRFDVTTLADTTAKDWRFEVRRDRWSGDERIVLLSSAERPFRFDCEDLAAMPPPCVGVDRWLQAIRAASPIDREQERIGIEFLDDARSGDGTLGTMRYAYFAQPPWVESQGQFLQYEALQVKHDAATGWFYHANIEAAVMESFLGSKAWPLCE